MTARDPKGPQKGHYRICGGKASYYTAAIQPGARGRFVPGVCDRSQSLRIVCIKGKP